MCTVFQILHYTSIYCNDGKLLNWYIDANIQFAGGCHLTFFLLSLGLVIFHIPSSFSLYNYLKDLYHIHVLLPKVVCKYEAFFDVYGGHIRTSVVFGLDYYYCSCCLSISYVSRCEGYNKLSCVNISINCYYFYVFLLSQCY